MNNVTVILRETANPGAGRLIEPSAALVGRERGAGAGLAFG